MSVQAVLFDDPRVLPPSAILASRHYLGPTNRGKSYVDEFGVMVFANPTSRRLPQQTWLELVRWCIVGGSNAGSQQWKVARRWILSQYPEVTTVVSYSDPSVGHTGALYRACNWLWAPTWQRLRPPPSGGGNWGAGTQAVKDRWVDALRPDQYRQDILAVHDSAVMRKMPWASFSEPVWRKGRPYGGGADYQRWRGQV